MSDRFAHIRLCLDLQESDVAEALGTREGTKRLLSHLSEVSSPGTGAAKALIVFARMATTACSWIDGDVRVDLVGGDEATTIESTTQLGGGLLERLLPPTSFRARISEFARAVELVPHMVAPLEVRTKSRQRIMLSATELIRRTTAPPPPIQISTDSLFARALSLRPPSRASNAPLAALDDIDGGWDEPRDET